MRRVTVFPNSVHLVLPFLCLFFPPDGEERRPGLFLHCLFPFILTSSGQTALPFFFDFFLFLEFFFFCSLGDQQAWC